jgi:Zn-dependent peptidase ImmA (M78 family)/DNA-binding XRE family transcriptional regulator
MTLDKKRLGKRIQQERERRGWTQAKLEKEVGLPEKAVTRIESGDRVPSTLELAKLAQLFHMPIGDFLESEIEEDPLVTLYRAAPGLERSPAIREEVNRCVLLCREGISLEKLLEQPTRQRLVFSASQQPQTALEAIRQGELAAREERKRLGIGGNPIRDIVELLTAQGIWCAATHLPAEISGVFLYRPSVGRIILVNGSQGGARQRFSYAHEYAHALFDAETQVLVSDTSNASELLEKRANAFAAAFLLPQEGISEILYSLNKGMGSRTSLSIFDVSTEGVIEIEERRLAENQKISTQDVAFIAHRFGASYQTVVYRLHSLQYLNQIARETLLDEEEKGKHYLRLLDLEDLEQVGKKSALQQELRTYITRLVIEAYRQEKISRGRAIELSQLLQLPAQELLGL